jgi:sugar phosphate permease
MPFRRWHVSKQHQFVFAGILLFVVLATPWVLWLAGDNLLGEDIYIVRYTDLHRPYPWLPMFQVGEVLDFSKFAIAIEFGLLFFAAIVGSILWVEHAVKKVRNGMTVPQRT